MTDTKRSWSLAKGSLFKVKTFGSKTQWTFAMVIMVWKGGEKLNEYQRTCPGSRAGYIIIYSILLYPTLRPPNSLDDFQLNRSGFVLFYNIQQDRVEMIKKNKNLEIKIMTFLWSAVRVVLPFAGISVPSASL